MSVARVYKTKKSQKERTCTKCRKTIPVGSSYTYFTVGFRGRATQYRHDTPECASRPSERESSKLAGAMSAVEAAEDELRALDPETVTEDDVQSIFADAATGIEEVAQEYRDAAESAPGLGETNNERGDILDASANELSSWGYSGGDFDDSEDIRCDEHDETDPDTNEPVDNTDCEACEAKKTEARHEWGTNLIDEAMEALGSVEYP